MNQEFSELLKREITEELERIQESCRKYVVESEQQRKMTFAGMRIAAEKIAALVEDQRNNENVRPIQEEVHKITASIDDLSSRFGSDENDRCRVCGTPLSLTRLGMHAIMSYCTNCPTGILDAVRTISDLSGAEVW